jgi:transcriptional regulator with XRE-family HTH domain
VDDDLTAQEDAARDQRVLGRALRALRNRAGITQEELASRAGTTGTYVSLVENGHRGVRWHTVMRLLRAMNVSARALGVEIDKQRRE